MKKEVRRSLYIILPALVILALVIIVFFYLKPSLSTAKQVPKIFPNGPTILSSDCITGDSESITCCMDSGTMKKCRTTNTFGEEMILKLNLEKILAGVDSSKDVCIYNYLKAEQGQQMPEIFCYKKQQLLQLKEAVFQGEITGDKILEIRLLANGNIVWEYG